MIQQKKAYLPTILMTLLLVIPLACKKQASAPPAAPSPISLTPQRLVFQCPPGEIATQAGISPDGHFFFITSSSRAISIFHDVDTTATVTPQVINLPSLSGHALLSPGGNLLAIIFTAPPSMELFSISLQPPAYKPIPVTNPSTITDLLFSPDSQTLAVAIAESGRDRVELYSTSTGQLTHNIPLSSGVTAFAFSPDNSLIAIANGNLLHVIDAHTGRPHPNSMLYREKPIDFLSSLAFSPDSATLAAYVTDGTLSLWTTSTTDQQKPLRHLPRIAPPVPLCFSPDGRFIAIYADSHPQLLIAKTLQTVAILSKVTNPVISFAFSPIHAQLFTTDQSGATQQWDLSPLK